MITKAWQWGGIAGVVGYAIFYVLSMIAMPYMPRIKQYYAALTKGGRAEWDSRVPSCVHAWVVVLGSYYPALFSEDHLGDRVAYYDDRLFVPYGVTGLGPEFFMGLFVGYLAADLVLLLVYRDEIDMYQIMIMHHVLAGASWVYMIGFHTMQWYACFMCLAELSTPLANLRWWLAKCRVSSSSMSYLLVGSWLFVTFFMARIMTLPFIAYNFVRYDAVKIQEHFKWEAVTWWSIALMVHCGLQSYWWGLMLRAIIAKFIGWTNIPAEGLEAVDPEAGKAKGALKSCDQEAGTETTRRTSASSSEHHHGMD